MTKVKRDWRVDPNDGSMWLTMCVEVNAKTYAAQTRVMQNKFYVDSPPPAYVERDLRGKLMRSIQQDLFGNVR